MHVNCELSELIDQILVIKIEKISSEEHANMVVIPYNVRKIRSSVQMTLKFVMGLRIVQMERMNSLTIVKLGILL